MSLFPCTKNTLITVCVYVRSANSILRVCILWKQVAYAYQKNLSMPATFKRQLFAPFSYTETSCLRGSQTCMHERFHWSQTHIHNYTSLSLLARRVVFFAPLCEIVRVLREKRYLNPTSPTPHGATLALHLQSFDSIFLLVLYIVNL